MEKEEQPNKKGEGGKEKGGEKEENGAERERERKREKVFRFSLRSMKIGSLVFVGVRGKVGPRSEGYAWVPKFGSFVKP